ncbi:MAG: hypothetical protein ASARMPRED_004050 [Alectoria sarmentosa]|nr:MAG: hypothetical protein ASARMPRED_004050 [Alectoria sarmentosa]
MSLPSSPSRFATRRDRSNTLSKTKTLDVGAPLAVYDTNSVRERVRQWQAQGGGVVTADSLGVEENQRLEKSATKSKTPKKELTPRTPSRREKDDHDYEAPSRSSRSSRRLVKAAGEKRDRDQSGSAPAKRVVSDGHWRKKRSPPKSTASSQVTKDLPPISAPPDEGIRVKPPPDLQALEKPGVEENMRTPKRESFGSDDDIRNYVTPPGSRRHSRQHQRRQSELPGSEKGIGGDIEAAKVSPASESIGRRKRPPPETSLRTGQSGAKEDSGRHGPGDQKAEDSDESPRSARGATSDGKGSVRTQKGNLLSHVFGDSRKIFVKQAVEPIATPRVPSIEAWLNETPDPFLDADEPPLKVILPLNPSSKKRKVTPKEEGREDPNRIWEALDTKEGTRRAVHGSRRRNRIPSSAIYKDNPFPADFDSDSALSGSGKATTSASKFVDLVQEAEDTSPSSLKRQTARNSVSSPVRDRKKSCSSKEPSKEDDAETAMSSSHTVSSVEGPDLNNPRKPPGLNFKRPFPSTGNHRLSTIASRETFNTAQDAVPPSASEVSGYGPPPPPIKEDAAGDGVRDHFDLITLKRKNSRLTKHADLISVLSLPKAGNKSIQSARSIRTNRSRLATATIGDLIQELATDESKYMRELRTLVDGVIPVLLTCVLSKSDSAVAAGLFSASAHAHENPNFTRPIIDMGIALERLKTLHRRIPQGDPTALLTWAHGAQRVYAEYLKAWRMGFQDVVVNLAPALEDTSIVSGSPNLKSRGLDEGLPRNEEGDVVNGDGERVDVAFLLKRPLVRLKYLAKTFKGINFVKPSAEAETLATKYQKLVEDARQRSNEERARLEDEAASNVDPTRARDPRTLAPLTGVTIDRTCRVRARDHFNLALQHSSGQRVDCRVELIIRDEASDGDGSGDLLFCEINETGRWLLFPPVQFDRLSARNGELKGEIVVMVRGISGNGLEWQELFSLRSEDEQAGFEWVQMLGLTPVPPTITRSQSFLGRHQRMKCESNASGLEPLITSNAPSKSRTPSPREVEIPIGEQGNNASKTWTDPVLSGVPGSPVTSSSREVAKLQNQSHSVSPSTRLRSSNNYVDQVNDLRSLPSQSPNCNTTASEPTRTPRSFKEALGLSGTSTSVGLKRARAKRLSRHGKSSPSSPKSTDAILCQSESQTPSSDAATAQKPRADSQNRYPNMRSLSPEPSQEDYGGLSGEFGTNQQKKNVRPSYCRSRSSVPSMELPYIPKARKNSPPTTPITEPEEERPWPTPSASQEPMAPSRLTKKRSVSSKAGVSQAPSPSSVSIHRSPKLNEAKTPVLGKSQFKTRRSSSPLKHEYEPSTASESSSESDSSTVEHNEATSVSDSSEDEELEEGDAPTPLMPLGPLKSLSNLKLPHRKTLYSTPDATIKPSESASQAPYKTVPPQPSKASKTIASIFSWSDTGSWQSLHPDECSIVITPGLIEAYKMSAAHSKDVALSSSTPVVDMEAFSDLASNMTNQNDEVQGDRPLVGLELTPLVSIRRGTALDISIRSPPTPNSQITSGNNIMFRSRNPEECEALYALINHSRINNPTFIALQNARGPYGSGNSLSNRRASTSVGGSRSSWFGGWGRSSSYRASSAPTPSIAPSDSSIGSMSSAFSALKRFGKGSGMFNISRSTIASREGSIYTSSDNSSGSGTSSPLPPGMITAGKNAPIGLSNAKIRLYIRETASKWRDMGSARLTIMRPDGSNAEAKGRPTTSAHQGLNEKRILVHGKTKGEVLLDVQLGESCFERVARTGIALSVWEDVVGPNGEVGVVGAVGGVGGGRATVYMIQVCEVSFVKKMYRRRRALTFPQDEK